MRLSRLIILLMVIYVLYWLYVGKSYKEKKAAWALDEAKVAEIERELSTQTPIPTYKPISTRPNTKSQYLDEAIEEAAEEAVENQLP